MKKYSLILILVLFLVAHTTESATDVSSHATLPTSLVSYWELEETSGTRVDTPGANDLTDVNTVLSGTGKRGTAADFEATNSEVLSITDASQSGLDITGNLSISMWLKPETTSGGDGQIFLSKWQHSSNNQYHFSLTDTSIDILLDDNCSGFTYVRRTWSYTMTPGTWYHLAIVYDSAAGSAEAFVDGSSIGTVTGLPTSIASCAATFQLSGRHGSAGMYFDGLMDEVGIWSKKLSSTEISDLYNGGAGLPYAYVSTASATSTTPVHINGGSLRIQGGTFKNTQL